MTYSPHPDQWVAPPTADYEQRGPVALITLNRPERLNAVNSEVAHATGEAMVRAARDDTVRAIVLTGAGRAFCAGADLDALGQGTSTLAPDHTEWGFAGVVQQWVGKPVIAAINGLAFGGGAEIVLACDLAVMDEEASLSFPEIRHGLISAGGGVIRLAQQIPRKVALEFLLTGGRIDAERAFSTGLVNAVAPAGTAVAVAVQMAEALSHYDPAAVTATKSAVYRTVHHADWGQEAWDISDTYKKDMFRAFSNTRTPRT